MAILRPFRSEMAPSLTAEGQFSLMRRVSCLMLQQGGSRCDDERATLIASSLVSPLETGL